MNKLDLVILVGGKGTRLGSLTKNIPKPLLKINGTPFLQYLINYYSKYNFQNIYLIAGYKGKKIKERFHNKIFNLIKVICVIEKKRKDTGGALFEIKKKIKNDFVLVNGDSFTNVDLTTFFKKKSKYNYIFLNQNNNYKENKKLVNLGIDKSGFLIKKKNSKLMNSGIYFFKKNILNKIENKKISLENQIISDLIFKKKIKGIVSKKKLFDIGIRKKLPLIKKNLIKEFRKPAIFFDRDGVINVDNNYVYKFKDFIFKKKIFSTLKKLKKFYLFIITNQSGIARGFYKEKDFYLLHNKLKQKFISKQIFFNDVIFCPHHPDGKIIKYKKKCLCRKPGNLMLKIILSRWNIDKKNSYMIGDKISDEICAKKSGIKFIYANENFSNKIK